jgi:hypothetical protein
MITDTAIIIAHVTNYEMTKNCVLSCLKYGQARTIVFVDNGTPPIAEIIKDDIGEMVSRMDRKLVYEYMFDTNKKRPLSCSEFANRIINYNSFDEKYLIYLNSDTLVTEDYDVIMRDAYLENQKDGCVAMCLPEIGIKEWKNVYEKEKLFYDKTVDGFHGTCFLIDRNYLASTGGFDERFYPACWEDVDFYKRVYDSGKKCLVTGRSCIMHYGAVTRNNPQIIGMMTDYSNTGMQYNENNRKKFMEKWNCSWDEAESWRAKMKEWHALKYEQFYRGIAV